ncbi:chloride channel protein [Planctomycetales bacterium]|nr:chloride channel protein [Planctomycetales bacterium]
MLGLCLIALLIWGHRHSLVDASLFQRRCLLTVRIVILILLVLALSGFTFLKPTHQQMFVNVLDESRSVRELSTKTAPTEKTTQAAQKSGWRKFEPFDAVSRQIKFGTDTETDIASAIQKALATVPPDYVPHLILMTDGNETAGNAWEAAKQSGAIISTIPIPPSNDPEVQLADIVLPNENIQEGEAFFIDAVIQNHQPGNQDNPQADGQETAAIVTLYRDAFQVAQRRVKLKIGGNTVRFQQTMTDKNQQEFVVTVSVLPRFDTILENNRLSTIVSAQGKPKIIVIDDEPQTLRDFVSALREQDIIADVRLAHSDDLQVANLENYDAVVLSNIPAVSFTQKQMQNLRNYVSERGGGLLMLGSEQSFGLGGYHKTPIEEVLPVRCELDKEKEKPSLALCLVIDRSGSMGGEKIELAKDAAKAAIELLTAKDYVAVIAFDNDSHIVCAMQSTVSTASIQSSISSIDAAGGTNIYPALNDAFGQLRKITAKLKHVILLTDGQSAPGDFEGVVSQMSAERMTVSTVGIGEADNVLLKKLAEIGRGRHYVCTDPQTIPQIFAKETITASKSALNEEPFVPIQVSAASVLDGVEIDTAPPLLGYVVTEPKPTATAILLTEKGDPLLITQRYGLGMSTAFTSDVKSRWAAEWLTWNQFSKFWSQVLRNLMRKKNQMDISLSVKQTGENITVILDSIDKSGNFLNDADGEVLLTDKKLSGSASQPIVFALRQTAAGRFETVIGGMNQETEKTLRIVLRQRGTIIFNQTRGLPARYPPELRIQPANVELLKQIAETTGGLFDPSADDLAAYQTDKTAYQAKPLWAYLLTLAAFLYVLDTALRRLSMRDISNLRDTK